MTQVSKEERNVAGVAAVNAILAAETEYSAKMRVPNSVSKDASDEEKSAHAAAKAAQEAAARARFGEFGFGENPRPDQWRTARVSVVTEKGDLKVMVSKYELADAQKLVAGEKLTWAKDGTHKETKDGERIDVEHKAGDRRSASATTRLLANNLNAVRNTETGKTGFDAIDIGEAKARLIYMSTDVLKQNAEGSKNPSALAAALEQTVSATRVTLGAMENQRYAEWKKSQEAQKTGGQER
ncbi:MAG: hypothetical protein H6872_05900 [Methylobacteriaceae bacterium]|nr:hypothetical protein [Methylobacteriaceae bacterium]